MYTAVRNRALGRAYSGFSGAVKDERVGSGAPSPTDGPASDR